MGLAHDLQPRTSPERSTSSSTSAAAPACGTSAPTTIRAPTQSAGASSMPFRSTPISRHYPARAKTIGPTASESHPPQPHHLAANAGDDLQFPAHALDVAT